jgi:hypothetical protein
MRDLVAREALRTVARDAAKRFRELVEAGHEIPYEVEEPGNGSPLPRYVPLTERFVRDHSAALLRLDSFGSACAAIESAQLAGPYLERLGIEAPPEGRRRAELAVTAFLCRLWMDSTDFSLDEGRLNQAVAELESGGEAGDDEIEVVVPIRGLRLPIARLELATATIVRADTVEVPPEARAAEGIGAAGWEPTFLAATRVGASGGSDADPEEKPDAGARAVEAFRQLITALRLFKPGGVGLGPYAWTHAGSGRWRRIATGAARPRPGGYRLDAEALGNLATLSRVLAYRSGAFGRPGRKPPGSAGGLSRAISRFEAGLERSSVLEALNDYLLALRFVLEGGGPADLGLSMRVAALCVEPDLRDETKAIVDRGLALERELWSGDPPPGGEGGPTAAEIAARIEDLTRAILRDAACGHLGGDLRVTADEILLADGLAVGEGDAETRGGVEEWELPTTEHQEVDLEDEEIEPAPVAELRAEPVAPEDVSEPELLAESVGPANVSEPPAEPVEQPRPLGAVAEPAASKERARPALGQLWLHIREDWREDEEIRDPAPPMQVPEPPGRIMIESRPRPQEDEVIRPSQSIDDRSGTPTARPMTVVEAREPDAEDPSRFEPERSDTAERVAYLFPRPETTEWDVRELSYDRRRRAAPSRELRVS